MLLPKQGSGWCSVPPQKCPGSLEPIGGLLWPLASPSEDQGLTVHGFGKPGAETEALARLRARPSAPQGGWEPRTQTPGSQSQGRARGAPPSSL